MGTEDTGRPAAYEPPAVEDLEMSHGPNETAATVIFVSPPPGTAAPREMS
jgi:hypothetical protein